MVLSTLGLRCIASMEHRGLLAHENRATGLTGPGASMQGQVVLHPAPLPMEPMLTLLSFSFPLAGAGAAG